MAILPAMSLHAHNDNFTEASAIFGEIAAPHVPYITPEGIEQFRAILADDIRLHRFLHAEVTLVNQQFIDPMTFLEVLFNTGQQGKDLVADTFAKPGAIEALLAENSRNNVNVTRRILTMLWKFGQPQITAVLETEGAGEALGLKAPPTARLYSLPAKEFKR